MALIRVIYECLSHVVTQLQSICPARFSTQHKYSASSCQRCWQPRHNCQRDLRSNTSRRTYHDSSSVCEIRISSEVGGNHLFKDVWDASVSVSLLSFLAAYQYMCIHLLIHLAISILNKIGAAKNNLLSYKALLIRIKTTAYA